MKRQAWNRTHPHALTYYALALPVIFTELALIGTSMNSYNGILYNVQAGLLPSDWSSLAIQLGYILPWTLVAFSVYALFSARPSTLIILQTVLFLFFSATVGEVDFFQSASLVLSSFSTLLGFSYLRAARLLGGRELKGESSGPTFLRVISLGFDLVLPISFTIGAMAIVALVMNAIQSQVGSLPQPLATLGTLYLQSNFYLILTTISVAGGVVWAARELLEPLVMRFTISKADAEEMAFSQIADIARKTWWDSVKKRGRGRRLVYMSLTGAGVSILILVIIQGPGLIGGDLLSLIGVGRAPVTRPEVAASNLATNSARLFDQVALNFEKLARFVIKLLWG